MKTKLAIFLLALGSASWLGAIEPKKAAKPAFTKPELKEDSTPVGEGKAPALTSYADMLDVIRPAVISVYSSKIVRQQVPPLLRQIYGPAVQGRVDRVA